MRDRDLRDAFSPEQRAVLDVMTRVASLLISQLSSVAHEAELHAAALRRLLERRGLLFEDEWERTLAEVEGDRRTLFQLDPEIQAGLQEIRRILGLGAENDAEDKPEGRA